MVFSSYVFLFIFLPSLIILYFVVPKKFRNMLLLVYSLVFYGWNVPRYLLILLLSIAINWLAGLLIHKCQELEKSAKAVLIMAVIANCVILGYYKYADFIIGNVNSIFNTNYALQNIVLPIGISFFTFQGLSYVIDVYRKDGEYQKNPFNVALYIGMFPQIGCGPIVRYSLIAKQLGNRSETIDNIVLGLQRFVLGLAKKIIIADTFGTIADYAFEATNLNTGLAWVGAIAYTLQIYFDFSGYSDMAIGLAKIFGFDFCENFNYPYISTSVTEFWRRWHISLSTWFRDYIYIPLGGNRVGSLRQIFNMLVIWSLTGLWHGSSWNFVLWGLYYFVWQLLEKYPLKKILPKIPTFIKWIGTFFVVMIGWVLFRAADLSSALYYLKTMFTFDVSAESVNSFLRFIVNYKFIWLLGIIAATPVVKKLYNAIKERCKHMLLISCLEYIVLLLLFIVCCLYVVAGSYNAFIYFQF